MSLFHALYVTREEVILETTLNKGVVSVPVTYSEDIYLCICLICCPMGLLVL